MSIKTRLHKQFKRLFLSIFFMIISLFTGVFGYMFFENYTLIDAFYMTVMAISTVGFGEVRTLSDAGKVFTSFYIIFNFSAFGFFVSVLTRYLFEGELKDIFSNYMEDRELGRMKDHVIICGIGRNGHSAMLELEKNGVPFVLVDNKMECFEEKLGPQKMESVNYIVGDATQEEVLKRAGIHKAKALIAAVADDSINVFISLTVREMNPNIHIVARASSFRTESKLRRAGANSIVLPDTIGGYYMANMVSRPEVVEFLDMINGVSELHLNLEEYGYKDFLNEYKDKSIMELNMRNVCGVTIIGYKCVKQGYIFNPNSHTVLTEGDIMIILGGKEELKKFKQHYIA